MGASTFSLALQYRAISPASGMLLDLLDDGENTIQRWIYRLRVVTINANRGRVAWVEGEFNPARHASNVPLVESATDDHIRLETFHHLSQLPQLGGLHLHVGAQYFDGSRKRAPVSAVRVLERDYYLDLGYFFMLPLDRSPPSSTDGSMEANQGDRAYCRIPDTA